MPLTWPCSVVDADFGQLQDQMDKCTSLARHLVLDPAALWDGASACWDLVGGWVREGRFISHPSHSRKRSGSCEDSKTNVAARRFMFHLEKMSCTVTYQSFHFYSVKHETALSEKRVRNSSRTENKQELNSEAVKHSREAFFLFLQVS